MQDEIYFVFFAETIHEIASDPNVVGCLGGTFREDLEFPLALGDFSVDAFVVDAGGQTELEVFLNDGAGEDARTTADLEIGATEGLKSK